MTSWSTCRRKLGVALSLPPAERLLLAEAALWLAVGRIAARLLPLRVLARRMARAPGGRAVEPWRLAAIRRAVSRASANVPWKAVCMQQALAAQAMLSRRGFDADFHLGAGFDAGGKLIVHAWVAAEGEIVAGAAGLPGIYPLALVGRTPGSGVRA